MEWFSVISLILLGITLIIIEVIFIPGTTVVGIGGFICTLFGVYLGYDYFGTTVGTIVLVSSLIVSLASIIYAFKTKSWERFSLKESNTGRVNEEYKFDLAPGDTGKSLSSLKPVGKAIFKDREVEVSSEGGYIAENVTIEIIKINRNKIIVKSIP